uniref:Putative neurofilament heavy polypeptide-like n=1 Tax=Solanum chacoense TaxID=4108 RepID=A0A0V0HUJ4_SOLCH
MGGDHKEKTTIMVLKVDLQCPCCFKKAKKILCKMPQVRDQKYDEKANTITILVVCCSPERIRDKLCCKGGKAIKSIEIKEPAKPKEPEKPKGSDKPKEPEKSKEPEKKPKVVTFETPKEKPKEPEKPKDKAKDSDKPKGQEKPTVIDKPKDKPKDPEKPKDGPTSAAMVATPWISEPMMMMPPVHGYPQAMPGCGCGQCHYTGGPCYQYYGTPVPHSPLHTTVTTLMDMGPPAPSSYYGNNDYYNEENGQGCTIM